LKERGIIFFFHDWMTFSSWYFYCSYLFFILFFLFYLDIIFYIITFPQHFLLCTFYAFHSYCLHIMCICVYGFISFLIDSLFPHIFLMFMFIFIYLFILTFFYWGIGMLSIATKNNFKCNIWNNFSMKVVFSLKSKYK
jgi:hypothetical protein